MIRSNVAPPVLSALTVIAAAMGGAASAQTTIVSPNPIYERSEGPGSCGLFGAFSTARFQIVDGNLRGGATGIKEICFRHDDLNYDVTNGMGRRWQSVVLAMSEGDLAAVTTTYSTNSMTTPVQVFSGSVDWPVQLGPTPFIPSPFGLKLPFQSVWSYSGTRDVVSDFKFTGGTLDNQVAWNDVRPYALDSFGIGTTTLAPSTSLGYTNGGCRDSNATSLLAATVRLSSVSYGPNNPNPSLRDKYSIQATGANFPRSSPVMLILSFLADTQGVFIPGINCNNFHPDLRRTLFFNPLASNAVGEIPPYSFGLPGGLAPYTPAWAGFNLMIQAAWADTGSGALKLSTGSRTSFVANGFDTRADVKMKAAYGTSTNTPQAGLVVDAEMTVIPIFCYSR